MMVILMVLLFCPDAGQDVLLITGAVFGEGHGPGSRPVQQMAEPQGAGAGGLDLHQHLVRPQQGRALVPQAQVQIGVPPAQAGVEGDAQLRVLPPGKGRAVIADEDFRLGVIEGLEPADLPPDLAEAVRLQLSRQQGTDQRGGGGDAPLIDHAVELLFDLYKDLAVRGGHAIAAHPQLLLIYGLFQTGPDEPPVGGVVIDVADGVFPVLVGDHMGLHARQHHPQLGGGEHVFLFIPLKAALDLVCHVGYLLCVPDDTPGT